MKKLVITPWPGINRHLLDQCQASVEATAPPGTEHLIVECGADWGTRMFELRDSADLVAWVDYDDVVYPGALSACFAALEANPTLGLAYTSERLINLDGLTVHESRGKKSILDLLIHPRNVHHLSVTRKGCVDNAPLDLYNLVGEPCPLDWLIRARAGAQHGMIYVPMVGYGWRRHPGQLSSTNAYQARFLRNMSKIRKVTCRWPDPHAKSLQYEGSF